MYCIWFYINKIIRFIEALQNSYGAVCFSSILLLLYWPFSPIPAPDFPSPASYHLYPFIFLWHFCHIVLDFFIQSSNLFSISTFSSPFPGYHISQNHVGDGIFSPFLSSSIQFKTYPHGCSGWKFTHFYRQPCSIGHAQILMDTEFQFREMNKVLETDEVDGFKNMNITELCS